MIAFQDHVRIGIWLRKLIISRWRPNHALLQLPYHCIGNGVNRKVFDLGNGNVLKVAISKRGIQDIIVERKLWQRAPYSMRKYLAKVIYSGSGWLIMKKYSRLLPNTSAYDHKVYRMMREFRKYGYEPSDLVSNRTKKVLRKNLRLRSNGQCIVIDYGFFYKIKQTKQTKQEKWVKRVKQNSQMKRKKRIKRNERVKQNKRYNDSSTSDQNSRKSSYRNKRYSSYQSRSSRHSHRSSYSRSRNSHRSRCSD